MKSCGGASSSRSRRGMPGGCSKEADLKPHLIRYWLTPAADELPEERDERIADVCAMYREAPARVAAGERIISTDEMTGVQALERAAPGLPLRPGKVERREFEYIRHGTLSFMINFDVGEVIQSIGCASEILVVAAGLVDQQPILAAVEYMTNASNHLWKRTSSG